LTAIRVIVEAGGADVSHTAGCPHEEMQAMTNRSPRNPGVPPVRRATVAAVLLAASAWAAAQAPGADPLLARNLAATCANCHGTNGNAVGDMKPLAGVPADKLIAMLNDYRNGNLPATIMHQIVKGYTEEQIRLIAGYFASKTPARK
jgi:cytochrome c553